MSILREILQLFDYNLYFTLFKALFNKKHKKIKKNYSIDVTYGKIILDVWISLSTILVKVCEVKEVWQMLKHFTLIM